MVCQCDALSRVMKQSYVSHRKTGVTPWDSGDFQPALRDLILSNELDLPDVGRALVPGCGRVGSAKAH